MGEVQGTNPKVRATSMSRRTFARGAAAVAGMAAVATAASAALADEAAETAETTGEAAPAEGEQASTAAPLHRTIDVDVLVIGAGAAGTEAAISAANAGAHVVVVDKKEFGHCGDSGMHFSGRMTSSDFELEDDCPADMLGEACDVGGYIVDQELGMQVSQAYYDDRVTLKSENYGDIHFRDPETGKPYIGYSRDKHRLWNGFKLSNMSYAALKSGAEVMDYCVVTKIMADENGAAVGATAVDFKTGELYYFRAKSIVVATGGETGIWGAGTVSAKYGGGVYSLTGDGHSLTAPLGVEFRDLEFRSLYTYFGPITPASISNLCCLYSSDLSSYEDAEGNKVFEGLSDDELTLRRVQYEYERLQLEGKTGPNGGLFAPIDDYYTGNFAQAALNDRGYLADCWDQLKVVWEKNGADFSHMEVAPQLTYDYGGIVTNINGETGVDGLYAAGECAMHTGAQYKVFREFSSALVMGHRAGLAAAERAAGLSGVAMNADEIAQECSRVLGLLTNEPENPISVHELRSRVMDSAYKGSGNFRSETKCNEALAELDEEEALLPSMRLGDKSRVCNMEWMEALEVANMIRMARMDTLASLTRTESRGTHLRNEYPQQDNDNWIKNVYVKEVDGAFEVDVRDTVITDFPAPAGTFDMGGDVLENY